MSTPKKLRRVNPSETRTKPFTEQSLAVTLQAFAATGERIAYLCGAGLKSLVIGIFGADDEDIDRVCGELIASGHSVIRLELSEDMTMDDLVSVNEVSGAAAPFVLVATMGGYGSLLLTNGNNCTFGHDVPGMIEGALGLAS